MGLAGSLLATFTFIAASCGVLPPEAEELGQSEAALGTGWQSTTQMPEQRRYHSATVLASNKVLVVGGWSYSGLVAGALTYDPATATWSPAGTLALAREAHTATRLSSGKVLVAGGETFQPPSGYTHTAELYDPATNSWSPAGAMSQARGYNTATLLPANAANPEKVLVAGGLGGSPLQTVDIYNTATGTWSTGAPLLEARHNHTAVRLASSGKVLVAGGWGGWAGALATTELYDPATNTWTAGSRLTTARHGHTVTELPNGKILVVGGQKDNPSGAGDFTATAELYDPSTQTWSPAGTLGSARGFHTATLVAGKVLVAGGRGQGNVTLTTAEVYDPATHTWSSTHSMLGARSDHAAVYSSAISKVLVIGGSNNSALATAEVYDSCGVMTCNASPGTCYAASGTCSNGTCSYAPRESGALCNDDNACTTGDTCNGSGVCIGTAMTCSTASSYYCSGNAVRKATGTGTCSGGTCGSTDTLVQTCQTGTSGLYCSGGGVYQTVYGGCANGACTSTQRLVETCSTGSSYYCSGNQRWRFAGYGCSAGACDYSDDYVETCSTASSSYCSGNTLVTSTGTGCNGSTGSCASTSSSAACPVGNVGNPVVCAESTGTVEKVIDGTRHVLTTRQFRQTRVDGAGCSGSSCAQTTTVVEMCPNQKECVNNTVNPCTLLNLERPEDFVKVTYRDVLKREPEAGGLAFYVNALNGMTTGCGGSTWQCKYNARAVIAAGILMSPERGLGTTRCTEAYKQAFITALYTDLLQRAPRSSMDEPNWWVRNFSIAGCVEQPGSSNSAQKLYENLTYGFITDQNYLEYPLRWGHTYLR